jgi:2-oxo-4-hydroxy-4-carboxy-5-ureidoimidazoline decarboxylase
VTTLAELNALDRERFIAGIGWAFEASPWVAERAWAHRPFASVDRLCEVMAAEVLSASAGEQLALLRAHPDLGTRARMTEASTGEQAAAGLDSLTADEFDRLQRLNTAYRLKFGFPFLFAVKGSTKAVILEALERRLAARDEDELAEALRQVFRIARFRLDSAIVPG